MKKSVRDPSHPSVTLSVEVPDPPDRSGRFVTKCERCNRPMSFTHEVEHPMCAQCKTKVEEENRVYLTCKDCGKRFYIKKEKAEFLGSLGFTLPVRCYGCHVKRKHDRVV